MHTYLMKGLKMNAINATTAIFSIHIYNNIIIIVIIYIYIKRLLILLYIMAKNINIYIISTEELKNRINNINNVVSILKNLCSKNNIKAFINLMD